MEAPEQRHFRESSYREMVVENLFMGCLLRHLWENGVQPAEVLHSMVDNSGYDVVIECNGVQRHIQFKSQTASSKRRTVEINERLEPKKSGCVLWIIIDAGSLAFERFYLFSGVPGAAMPPLSNYPFAKKPTANSKGEKPYRKNTRRVPRKDFKDLGNDIAAVAKELFGNYDQKRRN